MDDTKNPVLNPLDPSGTNPPADSGQTPPPLVPDAPPAPPPDSSLPPMPEPGPFMPPQPGADRPLDETPEEQPTEGPPAGEAGGLPPVITPPASGPKAKLIASIIGLVLLVVSIPAGIILVGRQQDIREKAATPPGSVGHLGACTAQADCGNNLTCKGGRCLLNSGQYPCCGIDSQCKSGETCSVANGACESNKSCQPAESKLGTTETQGKVGLLGVCSVQADCQDNLTCKDVGGEKKCRLNSGQYPCCGNDTQCNTGGRTGETCTVDNGSCESGKSCQPATSKLGTTETKGKVGLLGICSVQADCQDNLTCQDIGGEKKCRLNSGQAPCCGLDSQCKTGEVCSPTGNNGTCQSNRSCISAPAGTPQAGPGTPAPGLNQSCASQAPVCADNLSCTNGVCKKNNSLNNTGGCCANAALNCPSGQTCTGTDSDCQSGKTCVSPTSTGACAVTEFLVYESPFGDNDKVADANNKFRAGQTIRFVAKVPPNATRVEITTCEASQPCDSKVFSSADQIAGPPGSTYKYYKDLRLGNIGSVTAKARCAI
ncbi:MAG: hypothetical protein Q7S60_03315 [bacterium]|nr:hypothetical protein [bacterium]